MSQPAPAFLV